MENHLFAFGMGYSARALAERLRPLGWRVSGTTRDGRDGTLRWPGTPLDAALQDVTHVLISAAPDAEGDPVLNGAADALRAIAPKLKWLGYLSTTGVYGDHGGGWVDEQTPLNPATARGRMRVQAEEAWQRFSAETGAPLHIFRLAGIYGPGRGPFEKVRAGTAQRIIKPGQVFSRIHVDDIAAVLLASIERPNPGAIYNVCDNLAAPPQDVLQYAAELIGVELPPPVDFDKADMHPMARSFYAENKRVSNARIIEELGVKLRYPTYREGLEALLETKKGAEAP